MPCRSEYQEPNDLEIENSKVLAIMDELATGKLPSYFGKGSNPRVYNISTKEKVDKNVSIACKALRKLKKDEIKAKSLELQLWWREHQKEDRARANAAKKAKQDALDLANLKKKLSPKQIALIKNS